MKEMVGNVLGKFRDAVTSLGLLGQQRQSQGRLVLAGHSPGALTVGNSGRSPGVLSSDDQVGEQVALANGMQPLSTAPSTWQLLSAQNSAHSGYYQLADIRVSQVLASRQLLLWPPKKCRAPSKEGRPCRDEPQLKAWVAETQDSLMEAATWCQEAGQTRVGFLPSSPPSSLCITPSPSKACSRLRLRCPVCSNPLQPKSSEPKGHGAPPHSKPV